MFSYGDQKGAIGLWELFNNIKDLKIQSTVWLFTGKHRAKKPQTKTTNTVKNLNVAYMQARSIGGRGSIENWILEELSPHFYDW